MRPPRSWALALAGVSALAGMFVTGPSAAACRMGQVAALPVTLTSDRMLLDARINDEPVKVILDTGAQSSLLLVDAARRLHLPLADVAGVRAYGAGGEFQLREARVRTLSLAGVDLHDLTLRAGGTVGGEAGVALLLGQDVLSHWDVEYDLAHGAVRLLRPDGCQGDQVVYWASTYARAPMQRSLDQPYKVQVDVQLGRAGLAALMDTGAPHSLVTPAAALRAGGVREAAATSGEAIGGLGANRSVVAPNRFDRLEVGGEVLQHPRLSVSDIFAANRHETTGSIVGERDDTPDMILGLDFFRAHRILVAPDQGLVYLTYAGGPVFELPVPARPASGQVTGVTP